MITRVRWARKMLAGYIMSRVCLRWDYVFRFPFCIYRVACVELAHSSLGDWKNMSITHLIIIIKSEVSTFPFVVIFFRGCVSEMVVLSSREHRDLVSIIDVQSMVFANNRIHYGLQVVFVCLQTTPSHYHHYAELSESIELLKCLSGIWCRVCV